MDKRRFYIRVIPDERTSLESFDIDDDQKVIWFHNLSCTAMTKLPYIKFETDGIFTDACQAFIYDTVLGQDLVSSVLRGEDIVVLAYGSNGTGKTFTMTGIQNNYYFRGIIPRLFESLFELKQKKEFTMRVLALEFINGTCYDLLSNPSKEVDCRKLKAERLKSEKETLELLFRVESSRKSVSRENCGSMVLTVFVEPSQRTHKKPIIQKIHLVDTAGTEVHWSKMRERPCMQRNVNNVSTFVYDRSSNWAYSMERAMKRQTQPTNLFRNCQMVGYLVGSLRHGSIRLIGHVRRSQDYLRYTLASLRFGCNLTGRVEQLNSRAVTGPSLMTINQSLEQEVQRLRDELALTDLLENGVVPLTVPKLESHNLQTEVENYLRSTGTVTCEHLMNMAHPFTVIGTFKSVYRRCITELKDHLGSFSEKSSEDNIVQKRHSKPEVKSLAKKKSSGSFASKLTGIPKQSQQQIETTNEKPNVVTQELLEGAKLDRQTYWKEFLSRHPYWHKKLTAIGEDLKSARKERRDLEDKLKEMNKKLHENRSVVERMSWERTKELGEVVDSTQITAFSEERKALGEQEELHQEYKTLMNSFRQAHHHYIEVSYKFNEAHEAASKLFTEYVSTTYWDALVLPGGEDYEETIPMLGQDLSKKPTLTKSEESYIALQNKHLYRDRRDPPHPRWP